MVAVIILVLQLVHFLVTVLGPVSEYVLRFIYRLFVGKTKALPPIDDKILLMPATTLAKKIREKEISCEDVVKAYINRSQSVHPIINAVTDDRYEAALQDAKHTDWYLNYRIKSDDDMERDTPLLGVPFTCKEQIGVKGMKQTAGHLRYKDNICGKDGSSPSMYKKAGAIPLNVTNVSELCTGLETYNQIFGRTKNPFDHTRSTGGSSGGEAAIITSGGALIGIGNDKKGSLRIPSSFCGIFGHMPSRGIVDNSGNSLPLQCPNGGVDLTTDFESTGPMCRYAKDLRLLMKVLSNNDNKLRLDEKVDFRKMSLYYIDAFPRFLHKSVSAVKKSLKTAVQHFEKTYNITAVPLSFPELECAFDMWECKHMEQNGVPFLDHLTEDNGQSFNGSKELFKSFFHSSKHTLPIIVHGIEHQRSKDKFYYSCLEQFQSLELKFAKIFQENALLLIPTQPTPPPHHLMTLPMYKSVEYASIFNLLGLPVTQIPAGMSNGLPIGIQAVSGPMKDRITIAAALELENVFGGWNNPCLNSA